MYTDEEREYVIAHTWAILATGRADGSPQQAMMGYSVDPHGRLLFSTHVSSAKWRNVTRRPKVSVSIPDGRLNLVIYGTADTFDRDPDRAELSADVLAVVLGMERADPSTLVDWLDQDGRGVIRVTPTKAHFHTT